MNTRRVQLTLATLSLLLFTPPVAAEDAPKLVEPLEVRAVVADGKHNAFTAFARWKDAYWLSFRKATSHGSGDGDLIVLRSPDAEPLLDLLEQRFGGSPEFRAVVLRVHDLRLKAS